MQNAIPAIAAAILLALVAACSGGSSAPYQAPYSDLDRFHPGVSDGGGGDGGGGAM